jgi:hypothetical protein
MEKEENYSKRCKTLRSIGSQGQVSKPKGCMALPCFGCPITYCEAEQNFFFSGKEQLVTQKGLTLLNNVWIIDV